MQAENDRETPAERNERLTSEATRLSAEIERHLARVNHQQRDGGISQRE
jgi:hypothetical protein